MPALLYPIALHARSVCPRAMPRYYASSVRRPARLAVALLPPSRAELHETIHQLVKRIERGDRELVGLKAAVAARIAARCLPAAIPSIPWWCCRVTMVAEQDTLWTSSPASR